MACIVLHNFIVMREKDVSEFEQKDVWTFSGINKELGVLNDSEPKSLEVGVAKREHIMNYLWSRKRG